MLVTLVSHHEPIASTRPAATTVSRDAPFDARGHASSAIATRSATSTVAALAANDIAPDDPTNAGLCSISTSSARNGPSATSAAGLARRPPRVPRTNHAAPTSAPTRTSAVTVAIASWCHGRSHVSHALRTSASSATPSTTARVRVASSSGATNQAVVMASKPSAAATAASPTGTVVVHCTASRATATTTAVSSSAPPAPSSRTSGIASTGVTKTATSSNVVAVIPLRSRYE